MPRVLAFWRSLSRYLRPLAAAAALVLLAAPAAAAPAVSGVQGTVANGQSIVVTGSGFGATGPTVAVFDDFESGTVGGPVPSANGGGAARVGVWTAYDGLQQPMKYVSDHLSGSKSARADNTTDYKVLLQANLVASDTRVFYSYWTMVPSGINWPGEGDHNINWKQVWAQGANGVGDNDIACPVMLNDGYICAEDSGLVTDAGIGYSLYPGLSSMSKGQWRRIWVYLDGAPGTNKGIAQVSELTGSGVNSAANVSDALLMFPGGSYHHVQFNANANSASNGPTFDDTYVASGPAARARVEIGNASTYAASTNLTLCTTPAGAAGAAWANGSITCTVRQGSFAGGATAYVYVIDAAGNVSNGQKVTFGGTSVAPDAGPPPLDAAAPSVDSGSPRSDSGNVVIFGRTHGCSMAPSHHASGLFGFFSAASALALALRLRRRSA